MGNQKLSAPWSCFYVLASLVRLFSAIAVPALEVSTGGPVGILGKQCRINPRFGIALNSTMPRSQIAGACGEEASGAVAQRKSSGTR